MFGFVDAALVAAVMGCGYALWVRRHTWGSQWDTNPSRVLILIGAAGLMLSPLGSMHLDPLIHRVCGLWNVAGLLGVLCMFGAVAVMFEHFVMRLSDSDHQTRALRLRHVTTPLMVGLPLLVVTFGIADRGQPEYLDAFALRGPWFTAYWTLTAVLAFYLFGLTGRILLTLRGDPRSRTVAQYYLVWVVFKSAAIVAQLTSVLLGSTVTLPTWICAGVSSTAFIYASVLSWRSRTDWFSPARPIVPEISGD